MHTRTLVIAAVAGVAGAAVAVTGPAAGAGGDGQHHGHTVSVLSVPVEDNFVDTGVAGPSLGDMYVFHTTLKRHGDSVGHAGVVCTVTSTSGEAQCPGTAWFDGKGQITAQGLVPPDAQRFWLAVTGGTGKYAGASGTLEVTELGGGRERLRFHLED